MTLDPQEVSRAGGGETLRAFAARVAEWLDEQVGCDGPVAAITHGGVVKAALVHALGAPLEAFWRIDAAPLTVSELHAHDGRWTVTRVNCPVGAGNGNGLSAGSGTTAGVAAGEADASVAGIGEAVA